MNATFSSASPKRRSAGASYTGLPPSTSRASTLPPLMSLTSSPSDCSWLTGAAATGSVWSTVTPMLPRAPLMAWQIA